MIISPAQSNPREAIAARRHFRSPGGGGMSPRTPFFDSLPDRIVIPADKNYEKPLVNVLLFAQSCILAALVDIGFCLL